MTTITLDIVDAVVTHLQSYGSWSQAPAAITPGLLTVDEELVKTGPVITVLVREERGFSSRTDADAYELTIAVEAFKAVPTGGNAQAVGLALVGELKKALLPAGESYLDGLIKSGSFRPSSSGVDLPESGERTVAGRLELSMQFIERRNNIIY